jgi:predicted metal-dependent hydrolase
MASVRKTASRRGFARERTPRRRPRAADPQQLALLEPGAEVIRVRESTRAKRMTIHVTPHLGVEVVVPRRTPARDVQRFVSQHLEWIEETEEELANTAPPFDRNLPLEIRLPAIDQTWRVRYRRTNDRGVRLCELPGAQLELSGAVHDEDACRARLRQWLSETARTHLGPWLERISERTGLWYNTMQIRGQRTRWGSCSTQRTISLNYCLLFLARPARPLPAHPRAVPHAAHESRVTLLGARREPGAAGEHARRRARGCVARSAGLGYVVLTPRESGFQPRT